MMRCSSAWSWPSLSSSCRYLLIVASLPFLLRCGGDDANTTAAGGDAGTDGSTDPGTKQKPGTDGGGSMGTDGGGTAGPEPAWATAPLKSPGCGMAATP